MKKRQTHGHAEKLGFRWSGLSGGESTALRDQHVYGMRGGGLYMAKKKAGLLYTAAQETGLANLGSSSLCRGSHQAINM